MTTKIEVPLDGGMDQRSHPRVAQNPNVLQAVNVRYKQLGGVEKRPGSHRIGNTFVGGYQMAQNAKVLSFDDEVLVIDGFRCGSYSTSAGQERIVDKGKVPECMSTSRDVDTSQYTIYQQDIAYSQDGLIFHAWVGQGNATTQTFVSPNQYLFYTVEDADTGAELRSSVIANIGFNNRGAPRFVVMGSSVILLYQDSFLDLGLTSYNIYYKVWDSVALDFGSEHTLVSGIKSTFDAFSDGTTFYTVYVSSTTSLQITRWNTSGAIINQENSTEAGVVYPLSMSIHTTGAGIVWIAYATGDVNTNLKVRAAAYDHLLSMEFAAPFDVFAPTQGFLPRISVVTRDVSTSVVAFSYPALSGDSFATYPLMYPVVSALTRTTVGNATAPNRQAFWSQMISRPFIGVASPLRIYAWAYVGGATVDPSTLIPPLRPLEYTTMLLDLSADDTASQGIVTRPITWQAPRISAPINGLNAFILILLSAVCSVADMGNGKFITDTTIRRSGGGRLGLARITADFLSQDRYESAEIGHTLLMTPGWYWDRKKWCEINYSYWPQLGKVSVDGTGSATNITAQFRCCYEQLDGNLFVHRSDVSEVFSIVLKSDSANYTFTIPSQCVTARQGFNSYDRANGIRIAVYISLLNTTTGVADPWTLFVLTQNHPNVPVTTFTVPIVGDASVDRRFPEGVYTDGNVLANVMPPGFTTIATYRGRVWIGSGNTLYFSKFFVSGDTINFTDAFNLPIDERGNITAQWVMDDTMFASTETHIYYLQADGPTDENTDSDVKQPNRVATDLGVLDQQSVAVTPNGTMYRSSVGIQLLDRSRSVDVEPIGSRIQADLAAFPVMNSAIVHPTGRYVSFACSQAQGFAPGVRLLFDYALNKWSRDVLLGGNSIASGASVLSERVRDAKVYFTIAENGGSALYREDPSTSLDNGAWVPMAVEVAEVHPAALQGWLLFQRWAFMHERLTDYDLQTSWTRDYQASAFDSRLLTSDKIAATATDQFSQNVLNHKAQSMRILMQDASPSGAGAMVGTGQGARWLTVAIDVDGIDQRTIRLPSAQKS